MISYSFTIGVKCKVEHAVKTKESKLYCLVELSLTIEGF